MGGAPEIVWPHALAVHHVLDEAQWNRTWAMTAHWTAVLRARERPAAGTVNSLHGKSNLLKMQLHDTTPSNADLWEMQAPQTSTACLYRTDHALIDERL